MKSFIIDINKSIKDVFIDEQEKMKILREQITTEELIKKTGANPNDILTIGIAYQMHGLVIVDENLKPLRDSIIWCDSRAVEIGEKLSLIHI